MCLNSYAPLPPHSALLTGLFYKFNKAPKALSTELKKFSINACYYDLYSSSYSFLVKFSLTLL